MEYFGLALLAIILIILQYEIIVRAIGIYRKKVYSGDIMKKFEQIHKEEVGGRVPLGGNPDMGTGRYSAELDYSAWFSFNNWQRVHYNFLELLVPILVFLAVGALYKPFVSAIIGFVYFIGRALYSIGYCRSPDQRLVGAYILDVAFIAAFVYAVVAVFMIDLSHPNYVGVTSRNSP
mmetsp:Transcript_13105/g.12949  ORF Transcript_13105/g.12949 Transcript_13105/m.12949 type:complete len:177 (+) Transcript_13105:14-544(+)